MDDAILRMTETLSKSLKSTPAAVRQLTVHLSRGAGKNIRAAAVLTCAMCRDDLICADAVRAAAAVELVHLATLVHDDVLDDAARRRGIKTLHRKFGEKPAVLCGDYLFCLALELLESVRPREDRRALVGRTLPRCMSEILMGELLQDRNARNFALTERQYMRIIGGKTAALFEGSFYAGFLFSDEPDEAADAYKKIGRNIGLIFQLADDCADYEAPVKTTKKSVFSDYKRGVVTLPLIAALKEDGCLLDRIKAGIKPATLKRAIEASGGFRYTRMKIAEYRKKTEKLIAELAAPPHKKERLWELLDRSSGA